MPKHLLEIMDEEAWVALEEEIHGQTGANVAVYRPDGFHLTTFVAWANKVCPLIKSQSQSTAAICSTAVQHSLATVRKIGTSAVLSCDAGFCRICVPIASNGDFLGLLGICGLLLDEDVESFYVAKLTGQHEDEVERLAASACRITVEEAKTLRLYLEDKVRSVLSR